jgi:hypothetical protein
MVQASTEPDQGNYPEPQNKPGINVRPDNEQHYERPRWQKGSVPPSVGIIPGFEGEKQCQCKKE